MRADLGRVTGQNKESGVGEDVRTGGGRVPSVKPGLAPGQPPG